jgi:hypothetical protein
MLRLMHEIRLRLFLALCALQLVNVAVVKSRSSMALLGHGYFVPLTLTFVSIIARVAAVATRLSKDLAWYLDHQGEFLVKK